MTPDRISKGERLAIVHHHSANAQAPQRGSAHEGGGFLIQIAVKILALDYTVAGPDVVQQEIAERVKDPTAESLWHCECAAIDHRADRRSDDIADVADGAAYAIEQLGTTHYLGVRSRAGLCSGPAWRGFRGSHEPCECGYVVFFILVASDFVAHGCYFVRRKGIGYAHLIEVSAAGKCEQACDWGLPSEAANAQG